MKSYPHPLVEVVDGDFPVVLSVPHAGRKVPEDMHGFVLESVRGDKDADLLAYDILEQGKRSGASFSMVKALGKRSLLDLNGGERETRGIPQLRDYHQAYMVAIESCLKGALEHNGFAALLDVHGYLESKHRPRPQVGFVPGDVVFGTWEGSLVPERLHPAFESFRTAVGMAGFLVHPRKGFEEYGRLVGGDIVGRFGGQGRVAAIQMEAPSSVRLDPEKRAKLARAVAKALIMLAG